MVVYCWIFAVSLWGIINSDSGSPQYKWGGNVISQVRYMECIPYNKYIDLPCVWTFVYNGAIHNWDFEAVPRLRSKG